MENCVVIEERGTGKLRESLGDCNRCLSSYCAGWRDYFLSIYLHMWYISFSCGILLSAYYVGLDEIMMK
jgi:hypothetical protein